MNPRRPSPKDLKSGDLESGCIDYEDVREDFVTWLKTQGLTWHHYAKHMLKHLGKYSKPIKEPMDLVACFTNLNMSQKRHLVNEFRNLFKFYQVQGRADKQYLDLLRRNLPKTSIGVDLYIPSETEIIDSLKKLAEKDKGRRYFALYNLLLNSGSG